MNPRCTQFEVSQVSNAADGSLFLGIILRDGLVVLQLADPITYPGHKDWVSLQRITDAHRGFSLIVKHGRIATLFRNSELNPRLVDKLLEADQARSIMRILPCADAVHVFPAFEEQDHELAID